MMSYISLHGRESDVILRTYYRISAKMHTEPATTFTDLWLKPYRNLAKKTVHRLTIPHEDELAEYGETAPVVPEGVTLDVPLTSEEYSQQRDLPGADKLVHWTEPGDNNLELTIATPDHRWRITGKPVDVRREENIQLLETMSIMEGLPTADTCNAIFRWWSEHDIQPIIMTTDGLVWADRMAEIDGHDWRTVAYSFSMSWKEMARGAREYLDSIRNGHMPVDE